jgi:hypothetical protein
MLRDGSDFHGLHARAEFNQLLLRVGGVAAKDAK